MNIKQTRLYNCLASFYRNIKEYRQYKCKVGSIKSRLGAVEFFTKETKIPPSTAVVIEPNPFHAETLPGYIKYFIDLGYNVDVFIACESAIERPFARMAQSFRVFVGDVYDIQSWIQYKNISRYSVVFFSTMFFNEKLKFLPPYLPTKCKNRVLGMQHSLDATTRWAEHEPLYWQMKNEGRIATLSEQDGFSRINPNYFGEIKIKEKNRSKVVFVAVGAIQPACHSHKLLIGAVHELMAEGLENFEVHVVGSGRMDMPQEISSHVTLCGRLDFPSMYKEIEDADFILALLDPYSPSQQVYLKGTTSGAVQLSLGFSTPMIINEQFAKAYTLGKECAVIHEDNNLYDAMKGAIKMKSVEYASIQQQLSYKCKQTSNDSIEALNNMLTRCIRPA